MHSILLRTKSVTSQINELTKLVDDLSREGDKLPERFALQTLVHRKTISLV